MYCYVSLRFLFKVFVVMSFYSYICINCFLIYYIYKRYLYIYIYTRWLTFPRVHAHAVHAGLTAWGRRCDVQAKSTVCYYAVVCYYAINCEYYAL